MKNLKILLFMAAICLVMNINGQEVKQATTEINWDTKTTVLNSIDGPKAACSGKIKAVKTAFVGKYLYLLIQGLDVKMLQCTGLTTRASVGQKTFSGSEWRLILDFFAENITGTPWLITLSGNKPACSNPAITCHFMKNNALEIKIPFALLGSSPVRMNIVLQTLYYIKDMVAREASFRLPKTGTVKLSIPGLKTTIGKPQLKKISAKTYPGIVTLSWNTNHKCSYVVKLFNGAGKQIKSNRSLHLQRKSISSFTKVAPGSYVVEVTVTNFAGQTNTVQQSGIIVPAAGKTSQDLWLRVHGKYIVDYSGKPFRMAGMARCQYHDDTEKKDLGPLPEQLEHYKKLGINSIRLAIFPNRFYKKRQNLYAIGYDKFVGKYIDPEVQAIINAGMYVIIDSHHISGTIEEAYARIPLWEAIAKRYKDEPRIAVYELWNESYLKPTGLSPASAPALRKWYLDCIKAIRKYDKKHIILVSDWNAGWGNATNSMWAPLNFRPDKPYNQVAFSKHMCKDHCNKNFVSSCLDGVANRWNVPLIIGELQLEPSLQTAKDLNNLLKILNNNPNQYSVWLWRPHPDKVIFADVWSPWAKKYASKIPGKFGKGSSVTRNHQFEKESSTRNHQLKWNKTALFKDDTPIPGFVKLDCKKMKLSGIALSPKARRYGFSIIKLKKEYPAGTYFFKFDLFAESLKSSGIAIYTDGPGSSHIKISPFISNLRGQKTIRVERTLKKPFSMFIVKKINNINTPSIAISGIEFTKTDRK
jgi:aryl-phospho-beta-D-glucosidase BglC (GH1 family)